MLVGSGISRKGLPQSSVRLLFDAVQRSYIWLVRRLWYIPKRLDCTVYRNVYEQRVLYKHTLWHKDLCGSKNRVLRQHESVPRLTLKRSSASQETSNAFL